MNVLKLGFIVFLQSGYNPTNRLPASDPVLLSPQVYAPPWEVGKRIRQKEKGTERGRMYDVEDKV